jgi:two-component system response regulator TctD
MVDDQMVELRNRELRLLEVFVRNKGQILSKTQLVDRLFSYDTDISENAIEVYVGRLRKKLETSGARIETVRGMGYRLHG